MESKEKHEINNILLIINSASRITRKLVMSETIDREKILEILDNLDEATQRITDMAND
jgi:two-component sensor histidine kinase